MFRNLTTAALAAAFALSAASKQAQAQKALVYCPVGIDATGCDRIVAALQPKFSDGVDRGFDGTAGTVDLKAADLQHYAVVVVPSLADDGGKQPYAILRSAASRLHFAINGRVAVYSGSPDQGSNNRSDKDAVIANLARWAANGHTRQAGLVGLVAFLDLSENEADRYSWVREMSLVDVSSDAEVQSISDATAVGTRGGNLLSVGGRPLSFSNMASYGLHVGARAASRTEVAAIGGSTSRQSILVTYSNADGPDESRSAPSTGQTGPTGASFNMIGTSASLSASASSSTTSSATLTTDKPDYMPGDTVTFTGNGFAPGDTVRITVHEDPTWSYPDRQFMSIADPTGSFTNRQMVIDRQDLGAKFVATAIGSLSGLVAQAMFTDGASAIVGTVTDAVTNNKIGGATVTCITTGTNPCNNLVTATTSSLPATLGQYTISVNFSGNSNTVRLTVSANGYLTATADVAVSNTTSPTQNFALTPSGPTKLAFTSTAFSQAVGTCSSAITVQTQNAGSAPTNVTSNTTVNLATDNGTSGAGAFYSTNTCATPISSVNIATGTNSGTVFYKATARGNGTHILTASVTGNTLTAAIQSETINKADQAALAVASPTSGTYGDKLAMAATGGSGTGALTFTVVAGSTACSIITAVDPDQGKLQITSGTGTCSITATKAGDNDFNDATSVAQTVTVAKKSVTIATLTASNKIYDGNTTGTLTGGTLSGVLPGDEATVGVSVGAATATFDNKNVGVTKTVNVTGLALSGSAAPNYSLSATTGTTTANITALTISGSITASNKVYDGTTAATIATRSLTGSIGGDVVTLTGGTATFADGNVGTAKTVTATGLVLSGGDAGNYLLSSTTATASADITAASVTGTFTANNKTYDGTTAATVATRSLTGQVSGDDVSLTGGTATFDTKNVGIGKTVTLASASLAGAQAGNYALGVAPITTTANITPLGVTGSIVTNNRVYDATTTATAASASVITPIGGDNVSLASGTLAFADKVVGNAKPVTPAGWTLAGTDAGNYLLGTVSASAANITPFALTASITADNKVYDGTTTAAVHAGALSGVFSGDVVSATLGTGSFATKSVGTAKTVSAGVTLSGADAANYSLTAALATTTADITPKALTVSATGVNRIYDGTTTATVTLADDRVSGDAFTDGYASASFADKSVGTGKSVNVSGISISGADAGNYTFNATASTTANITARTLTVGATGVNKVYDGNANATVSLTDDRVSGDVFTSAYTSASFNNKNVGTAKPVNVSGIAITGTDAGNYTANTTATASADITARPVTGSIVTNDKVYDATTAATPISATVVTPISGDNVSLASGTLTFASKNVGTGIPVTASGWSLSGGDAGNYALGTVTASAASITRAPTQTVVSPTTPINEGATSLALMATVSGPPTVDEGTVTFTVTRGAVSVGTVAGIPVSATGVASTSASFGGQLTDAVAAAGSYVITATFLPAQNFSTSNAPGATVTVTDGAPNITAASATTAPTATNSNFTVNAKFTDPGLGTDDYTATVTFIASGLAVQPPASSCTTLTGAAQPSGTTPTGCTLSKPTASADGSLSITRSFAAAGVYSVTITITDKAGLSSTRTVENFLVVYDPSSGFVTGGGWIDSPLGACKLAPCTDQTVGKATFGFVSKYERGANLPSGNTEFQFHAGSLNFKATVYEWLVVSGARAQYKGSGAINGRTGYQFLLTAIDGSLPGGNNQDRFRIKIVDNLGNIVYDNQMNTTDDAGLTSSATALGGGSINIKSK